MLTLNYAEFYITNVCNLTCVGCNRFNDTNFKGWQRWEDYKDIYTQWSKHLKLNSMAIMGGEPLLNSSFYQWLSGLTALWPKAKLEIATNGFTLPKNKKLYSYLVENKLIKLSVSVHNKEHKKIITGYVEDLLSEPFEYKFNNTQYRERLEISDSNGVTVEILYNWWFHQGAIRREEGIESLHNSDPEKAHDICHSKTCHHFDKGKLYKCGPAALFKEYDEQMPLTLNEDDRQLMLSTGFLSVDDSQEVKKHFIKNIENSIPQCKFCPDEYHGQQIFSQLKSQLIKTG